MTDKNMSGRKSSNQTSKVNIRRMAVQALSAINRQGAYANIILQEYITQNHLSDLDRRFFTELVYGVVRRRNYLDTIIEHLTHKKVQKLSSLVLEILRLGIYQLIYMDKVPESAAVNESVKLANKMTRGLSGFVNGVLRNVIRQREALGIDDLAKTEEERIALTYNQPIWLIQLWLASMTKDEVCDLCAWFNQKPRLTARINLLKVEPSDLIEQMEAAGWIVEQDVDMPEVLYIDKHIGLLDTSVFVERGLITFMDKASMLVAHVLAPQVDDEVLDTCAAPGGKSLHMATLMQNQGYILAGDIHEHKIPLMEENARRLGISIIDAVQHDARALPTSYREAFDCVLVDAPCSGLGILQKKLDMRWRKKPDVLERLPLLQRQILEEGAKALRPGGRLVYSTCTLNPKENEDVVRSFLADHDDFTLDPISDEVPVTAVDGMITTRPAVDDMDGFFIARLRKENA